ncbi:MAG: GtrA family protein [Pseudomonadota bacterium]
MIRHFFSAQFLMFLLVGTTAAGLHWLARYLLSIWLSFPVAVALAYCVGLTIAFALNKRYVFPTAARPVARQARDFVLVNLAFFPVVWGASLLLRAWLASRGVTQYAEGLAHGLAIAIPVFMTFLIYKFMTFGEGDAR